MLNAISIVFLNCLGASAGVSDLGNGRQPTTEKFTPAFKVAQSNVSRSSTGRVKISAVTATVPASPKDETNKGEQILSDIVYSIYRGQLREKGKSASGIVAWRDNLGKRDLVWDSSESVSYIRLEDGFYYISLEEGYYYGVADLFDVKAEKGFEVKAEGVVELEFNLNAGGLLLASGLSKACRKFGSIEHKVVSRNKDFLGRAQRLYETSAKSSMIALEATAYDLEYYLGSKLAGGQKIKASGAVPSKVTVVAGELTEIKAEHDLGCATFELLENDIDRKPVTGVTWNIYEARKQIDDVKIKIRRKTKPSDEFEIVEKISKVGSILRGKHIATLRPGKGSVVLKPTGKLEAVKVANPEESVIKELFRGNGYLVEAIDRHQRKYSQFFRVEGKKHIKVTVGTWHSKLPTLKKLPAIGVEY